MIDKGRACGMTGHGGDQEARSKSGANESKDRGGVQVLVVGDGDRESSKIGRTRDWKTQDETERLDGAD